MRERKTERKGRWEGEGKRQRVATSKEKREREEGRDQLASTGKKKKKEIGSGWGLSLKGTVPGFTLPGDRKVSVILTIGSCTGKGTVIEFLCKSRKHS